MTDDQIVRIDGRRRAGLSPERLWEALNEPKQLARIIPGCSLVVRNESSDGVRLEVSFSSDNISTPPTCRGEIILRDIESPLTFALYTETQQAPRNAIARGDVVLKAGEHKGTDFIYQLRISLEDPNIPSGVEDWRDLVRNWGDRLLHALDRELGERAGGIAPRYWVPGFVIATLCLVAASALL